jgi:hypothetical protein
LGISIKNVFKSVVNETKSAANAVKKEVVSTANAVKNEAVYIAAATKLIVKQDIQLMIKEPFNKAVSGISPVGATTGTSISIMDSTKKGIPVGKSVGPAAKGTLKGVAVEAIATFAIESGKAMIKYNHDSTRKENLTKELAKYPARFR